MQKCAAVDFISRRGRRALQGGADQARRGEAREGEPLPAAQDVLLAKARVTRSAQGIPCNARVFNGNQDRQCWRLNDNEYRIHEHDLIVRTVHPALALRPVTGHLFGFSMWSENWTPTANAVWAARQRHFFQSFIHGKYLSGILFALRSRSWVFTAGFEIPFHCRHGIAGFLRNCFCIHARFVELNHFGGRWPRLGFRDFNPNNKPTPFVVLQAPQLFNPSCLEFGVHLFRCGLIYERANDD